MSLLNLSPAEFCASTKACEEGWVFALTQPTMAEVWDNCPQPHWLLWIAEKLGQKPDDRTLRLFAIWCARNTPLSDGRKTGDLLTDPRSLAALEVAERFADGRATNDELDAAWVAAWVVQAAAESDAAWAAARAAQGAAWDASGAAAEYAAEAAEQAAAWDAERAAAGNAAGDAARGVAWSAQATHLRTLVPNPFRKEAQP